uniref:AlNc14C41G3477 protein n=1 Tax=Albugo laibachii Nc14 TaxID=890382 RepID=F0W9M2_9STRA|nr:AlNc14C41G3477 [Albugo laibachii Nc14]|eukprot:CCA17840.1 AlNc14C41G3477 [Albugo laibachii Nc14]
MYVQLVSTTGRPPWKGWYIQIGSVISPIVMEVSTERQMENTFQVNHCFLIVFGVETT